MLKVRVMPLTSCNTCSQVPVYALHAHDKQKSKNFDVPDQSQHACSRLNFGPSASNFPLQDLMPVPQTPRICAPCVLC